MRYNIAEVKIWLVSLKDVIGKRKEVEMRRSIGSLLIVLVLALFLSGCATPFPLGGIYTEIKSPVAVGSGEAAYTKVGRAKVTSILGLVTTGDGSIDAATKAGGIKKIKYIDYESKNILGFIGEYTTVVYGD